MSDIRADGLQSVREGTICLDREMAELVLLLPEKQLRALEAAARERGRTAAQIVRSLIRTFLAEENTQLP
jgi:hypothetical protein